jgi:hypothetical protein
MPRITNIQARKGTATDWSTQNPVLASGELGYDLTNRIFKIGDGSSNWNTLNTINLSSSNITDFNSSVSGLLPTIANSGDNRILTSTGSTVGINAESNLTFDGSLLTAPSGNFTNSLQLNNIDVSLIRSYTTTSSFPASGVSNTYYLASDSSRLYQWTGSYYAEIGPPVSAVNNAQNAANLYLWSNFK